MRSFAAVVLATSLLASSAFAGVNAPLAPGKPAGVKHAQFTDTPTLLVVAGIGIIAAGIALSASGNNNSITTASTTSAATSTTATSTTKTTGTTG
jgi:hypothetical protein